MRRRAVLALLLMVAVSAERAEPAESTGEQNVTSASQGRLLSDTFLEQRYDGHVVIQALPSTERHLDELRSLLANNSHIDLWKPASRIGEWVHFRIPPTEVNSIVADLDQKGLKHEYMITDVQSIIDSQTDVERRPSSVFGWNNYYSLQSIYEWMVSLTHRFPGVATLANGGRSTEGRRVLGVRIAHQANLPIILVEGGIHGREWISPAVSTYVLNQLLHSRDPGVARLARSFEWHIFPSVNPDGYEYSRTTDRLWRKSRKRNTLNCYGVDLNRNFPFDWNTVRPNNDFCSSEFAGTRAASEVETRTRLAYVEQLLPRTKAFISLHSYGQFLLLPSSSDYATLYAIASKAGEAFAGRYGSRLRVGTPAEVLYPISGSSMDWMHSQGVPFTFTFELRDQGRYGFLLPASQIIPASEETMDGIVAIANAILG